jgi:V-type H+-transporting ATPase subunit E
MTQAKGEAKILQMIEMIKKEAKEESEQIIADARFKISKEKNKTFTQAYENLLAEFKEKEVNDQTQRRLELSRKTNETRLDIQQHRSVLLAELKEETEQRLKEAVNDVRRYGPLLKELIFQGTVRLLEPEVAILCREQDKETIEALIPEVEEKYREFMRQQIGKAQETKLSVITKKWLEESEIGGVVLYCNRYRTVFNNSLKSRLDLAYENSVPDIRRILFPHQGAKAK